jgi:hypothetical protein
MYCDDSNPVITDEKPVPNDTTNNTTPHKNPKNNPFIGTWALQLDTINDGIWPVEDKYRAYMCELIFTSPEESHYECKWRDTLVFSSDSIHRGTIINGIDKLYLPAVYFYQNDSIFIVDRTPCMAVNCKDTVLHLIPDTYRFSGDTLFFSYISDNFCPYYIKVK